MVIRINKTTNYTVMSNRHFKEKEMTLKAKGLLSFMLSLPDDWDYSIAGLVAICKENESAIRSTLDELKRFGYLTVTKKMPNETKTGRIEYEYNIFEEPQKQAVEKQGIENQYVENQQVENRAQINTNKQSTDLQSTDNKESKKESKEEKETYESVFDEFGVTGIYREAMFRWIAHLQATGLKFVLYERLKFIIVRLDMIYQDDDIAKVAAIDDAIKRGYKYLPCEVSD